FHQHSEAAHAGCFFRFIHAKQDLRLMIELRFWAIQILRLLIFRERTTSERHNTPSCITYREHEPITETIIIGAGFPIGLFDEPRRKHLGYGKPERGKCLEQFSPIIRSVAE